MLFNNDIRANTFSATTITGQTFYSSSTELGTLLGEKNTMSNEGNANPFFIQKTGVNFELRSLIGGTNITITTGATTLTISSTGGSASTNIQPGLNTTTGGTPSNPTVNVSGGTFDNINVTGTSVFNNITGNTFYSGQTQLDNIFSSTAHTHEFSTILNTGHTHPISELIYTGTTPLQNVIVLSSQTYTRMFASSRTVVSSTNTTNEEILLTVILPPFTLMSGDSIDIVARYVATLGTGTKTTRIRIGTGATLTNAVAFSTAANTSASVTFMHRPIVVACETFLEGFPGTQSAIVGVISSGASTLSVEYSKNIYIHFTTEKATASDNVNFRYCDVVIRKIIPY